ncbi:hypothetical protein PGT21_011853 [Puccinia graminis f. sp. tritici]|uniref:RRM domain-containing protein n=2 Tax=Puccinia graminis f. sp. tritici TaxID=56615 RepID=E3JWE9_PUCGT|nr:uncharacterized protein PGTG_02815 [Puccinia graminis f. sp. tritici CRL 75-36-700-3]EFP76374.1 hypothetical protein PGTG_02815 [Puccinia graminis f. sp. tritici CRL 75-36-700-3]KAA1079448.1 hypothetical protein PGT21_011853 [Puccinia graminis f. sp. tritici]KAA1082095.1 hypothetical protein PGTUg99_017740 [Puccinia graminis f. sp. tritici]
MDSNADKNKESTEDMMAIDESPINQEVAVKRKGRGFKAGDATEPMEVDASAGQVIYERLDDEHQKEKEQTAGNAARSVEGWVVIVQGVHEEATEEDLMEKFSDYGHVMNLAMPLDRRTGYVKGYALVEYETRKEAEMAIKSGTDSKLLDQTLKCDFAFVRAPTGASAPIGQPKVRRGGRSRSPPKKPLVNRID